MSKLSSKLSALEQTNAEISREIAERKKKEKLVNYKNTLSLPSASSTVA